MRILGDVGITAVGAGLGWAASGTIATYLGARTVPALAATIAGWFGFTVASATPMGWAAGIAAAGGLLACGTSRLIQDGSMSEGRKKELLQVYAAQLREFDAKERSEYITVADRTRFITGLRELIGEDILTPKKAFDLIDRVDSGHLPIAEAASLVADLVRGSRLG